MLGLRRYRVHRRSSEDGDEEDEDVEHALPRSCKRKNRSDLTAMANKICLLRSPSPRDPWIAGPRLDRDWAKFGFGSPQQVHARVRSCYWAVSTRLLRTWSAARPGASIRGYLKHRYRGAGLCVISYARARRRYRTSKNRNRSCTRSSVQLFCESMIKIHACRYGVFMGCSCERLEGVGISCLWLDISSHNEDHGCCQHETSDDRVMATIRVERKLRIVFHAFGVLPWCSVGWEGIGMGSRGGDNRARVGVHEIHHGHFHILTTTTTLEVLGRWRLLLL